MRAPAPARDSLDQLPRTWRKAPLKHLADINRETLPEDTDPSFEFTYIDISSVDPLLGPSLDAPTTFGAAPSRARRLVRAGDVLVSTVRTYLRAITPVPQFHAHLVASTGFAVVTARGEVDAGFLSWWLQCHQFVEDVVARSVGVSYPATTATEVGNIYMPVPPIPAQQRIDAYLRRECDAIDRLAQEQTRQLRLLEEHLEAFQDEIITTLSPLDITSGDLSGLPRLKQRVERVTVGIVITPSKWYAPTGAPALRGLNVRPGVVTQEDLVFITDEGNEENSKSRLRAGDVVVVRTGNAGAAAVVPDWAVGGNAIDLLLVRPGAGVLPRYLELLINSKLVRDQVTRGSVGALQAHFNTSSLKNVRVVVPSPAEQRAAVHRADEARRAVAEVRDELRTQLRLLTEHRQAIISAAVTGRINLDEEAI